MIVEKEASLKDQFLGQLDILNNFSEDYDFNLVIPGDLISQGEGLIQGSGTYEENGAIYSSLIGYISKTNKLISVKPLKSRYKARVGDIVVGRVKEIVNKKWKIDINSYDLAQLHLNAVKLPEIQRRKTEEDERQMRQFLAEGDLIVAEVQAIGSSDKSISLHIRNDNFGKLKDGALAKINHNLIQKHSRHITDLSMGIKLILGMNGWIWLEPKEKENFESFEIISRLKNIFEVYDEGFIAVRMNGLLGTYNLVSDLPARDILSGEARAKVYEHLGKIVNELSKDNISDILAGQK